MEVWPRTEPGLSVIKRRCNAPWTIEQIRGRLLNGGASLYAHESGFIVIEKCFEPWTGEPYINAWLMWFKSGEAMKRADELVAWLDGAVEFFKCAWWQFGSPRDEWAEVIKPYCEKTLTIWRRRHE